MGSKVYIRIELLPYIKTFYEKKYGNPVSFPKKSYMNLLIGELLTKPPKDYTDTPNLNALCIELAYYINKDIRSYFHLSLRAKSALKTALRQKFYQSLCDEVRRSMRILGVTRKAAIYLFIEEYGLGENCFDSLKKKEYRERRLRPMVKEED